VVTRSVSFRCCEPARVVDGEHLANRATVHADKGADEAGTDAEDALELAWTRDWPWLEIQALAALAVAHARADRLPVAVRHAHSVGPAPAPGGSPPRGQQMSSSSSR
jgi:hypothetical protein